MTMTSLDLAVNGEVRAWVSGQVSSPEQSSKPYGDGPADIPTVGRS